MEGGLLGRSVVSVIFVLGAVVGSCNGGSERPEPQFPDGPVRHASAIRLCPAGVTCGQETLEAEADTSVWSASPSWTNGSGTNLYCSWHDETFIDRTLVRFSSAGIANVLSTGRELVRAELLLTRLGVDQAVAESPPDLEVRRLLLSWDEAVADWNYRDYITYPGYIWRPWDMLNGTATFRQVGQRFTPEPNTPNQQYTIDVTEDVAFFREDSSSNHGWVVMRESGRFFGAMNSFHSRESSTADARPKLRLVYRLPPATTAPALGPVTTATRFDESIDWLLNRTTGGGWMTAPSDEERRRIGVVRGRVRGPTGEAGLAGVSVSVLGDTRVTTVQTDADGLFDLPVLGGRVVRLRYTLSGYLNAERVVQVPWADFRWADDVRMIAAPATNGDVAVAGDTPGLQRDTAWQVVRAPGALGGLDGGTCPAVTWSERPITVLIPADVEACALSGDTETPLSDYGLRFAEYTRLDDSSVMPGALPPTSAFTYAADFELRNSSGQRVDGVRFRTGGCAGSMSSVVAYLPGMPGIGVGRRIPSGAYDTGAGRWEAEQDGVVLEIEPSGASDLTVAGVPLPLAERTALRAAYFPSGCPTGAVRLWRVPLSHFSDHDFNLSGASRNGGRGPQNRANSNPPTQCRAPRDGSIIECENRTLGEQVSIAGTPFALTYASSRVPGFRRARQIRVPLVDPYLNLPSAPQPTRVYVEVEVAGQRHTWSSDFASNMADFVLDWDGRDGWGRTVQGLRTARVRLGYQFGSEEPGSAGRSRYFEPVGTGATFGNPALLQASGAGDGDTNINTRIPQIQWTDREILVGGWDARAQKLAGWTIDVHHAYDPVARTVHLGDGTQANVEPLGPAIESWAGSALGCDAGASDSGVGDGYPATQARLCGTRSIAVGAAGELFVRTNARVRRVDADTRNISSVLSVGTTAILGEIAVTPDNALLAYIEQTASVGRHLVRCELTGTLPITAPFMDSRCTVLAGRTGPDPVTPQLADDSLPATQTGLKVNGLAVARDGTIFFTEYEGSAGVARVRRLTTRLVNGTRVPWLETIAGGPAATNLNVCDGSGSALRATCGLREARFTSLGGIAIRDDGAIYVADQNNHNIRLLGNDGRAVVYAGLPTGAFPSTSVTPTHVEAIIVANPAGLAIDADGSLLYGEYNTGRVRRIAPDATVTDVIGGAQPCADDELSCGNGGLARDAQHRVPACLAVGSDGALFVSGDSRVRRVAVQLPRYLSRGSNRVVAFRIPSPDGNEVWSFDHRGLHLDTRRADTHAVVWTFDYDMQDRLIQIRDGFGRAVATIGRSGDVPTSITGQTDVITALGVNAAGWLETIQHPNNAVHTFMYHDRAGLLATATIPDRGISSFVYAPDGLLERDTAPTGRAVSLTSLGSSGVRVHTSLQGGQHAVDDFAIDRSLYGRGDRRALTRRSEDLDASVPGATTTVGPFWWVAPDAGVGAPVTAVGAGIVVSQTGAGSDLERTTTRTIAAVVAGDAGAVMTAFHAAVPVVGETEHVVAGAGHQITRRTLHERRITGLQTLPDGGSGVNEPAQVITDIITEQVTGASLDGGVQMNLPDERVWRTVNTAYADAGGDASDVWTGAGLIDFRRVVTTSPVGRQTTVDLDVRGRVIRSEVSGASAMTYAYTDPSDGLSRSTSWTWGTRTGSSTETFTARRLTVAGSAVPTRTTRMDVLGHPSQSEVSGGSVFLYTGFVVGTLGDLRELTTPTGPVHTQVFDNGGQRVSYVPPGPSDTEWYWDWRLDQQPASVSLPPETGGTRKEVIFEYDELGRLNRLWGDLDRRFSYDGRGRMHRAWTTGNECVGSEVCLEHLGHFGEMVAHESQRLTADGEVALTIERRPDVWARLGQDVVNRSGIVGGAVAYGYDDDDLLTAASMGAPANASYQQVWQPTAARLASQSFQQGTGPLFSTALSYSATHAERSAENTQWTESGASRAFTIDYVCPTTSDPARDGAGRVLCRRERFPVAGERRELHYVYAYDAVGRLESATVTGDAGAGAGSYSYGYDDNGNRTAIDGTEVIVESAQDRIEKLGQLRWDWSPRGTIYRRRAVDDNQEIEYHYNAFGALETVTHRDNGSVVWFVRYVNDAFGRRVAKYTGTSAASATLQRTYVWDGLLRLAAEIEFTGGSTMVARRRYVYANRANVPEYMVRVAGSEARAYRFLHDHLGSVRLVVDAQTGAVVQELRYDPLGAVRLDSQPRFQPFGFAGGLYDPDTGFLVSPGGAPKEVEGRYTGFVRFGFRDYDGVPGRWMAKDPILFSGGDTNLYGYVLGDPVNGIDPSGLEPFSGAALAAACVAQPALCLLTVAAGVAAVWAATHAIGNSGGYRSPPIFPVPPPPPPPPPPDGWGFCQRAESLDSCRACCRQLRMNRSAEVLCEAYCVANFRPADCGGPTGARGTPSGHHNR